MRWWKMAIQAQFVAGGCCRAQLAAEPVIRAQVTAEFSEQLEGAGLWRRFWLRRVIEREVRVRLAEVAPPEALY